MVSRHPELFPVLLRETGGPGDACGCLEPQYTHRVESWDLIRRCVVCGLDTVIRCPDGSCGSGFRRELTGPHLRAVCWCGWWVGPIPKRPEDRSPRIRYLARRRFQIGSGGRCAFCGCVAQEIDHTIPLSRGGLDVLANMQPLCKRCHRSKTREDRGRRG